MSLYWPNSHVYWLSHAKSQLFVVKSPISLGTSKKNLSESQLFLMKFPSRVGLCQVKRIPQVGSKPPAMTYLYTSIYLSLYLYLYMEHEVEKPMGFGCLFP